jgi:bifunctional non-homologous end joining protein LigD
MATLAEYKRKRDFHITAEPAGRVVPRRGHSFVIQKHDATRLHYDFRLELDGVLKSWAVPKGPSLDPAVKRLAVEVEDHPLSYASFEGTIPEGEYGGGSVLVWDRGTWMPEGDAHEGLRKGRLRFSLDGEKLHGTWNLIRSSGRSARSGHGGGKPQWLLIKSHDEDARPESEYDVEMERPESVITGVRIEEVAANVDAKGRLRSSDRTRSGAQEKAAPEPRKSRKGESRDAEPAPVDAEAEAAMPEFIAPQLAVLVSEPPTGAEYIFENKFDGYRALARLDGRGRTPDVRVYTRAGNDWTERFVPIAEAVASLDVDAAYLDGEIVAIDDEGKSNFQVLQNSLSGEGHARLVYHVFDLLFLNGHDLRRMPLLSRKEILEQLLRSNPHPLLRYSEHWTGDGRGFLSRSCNNHQEGMVCKDSRKAYVSGRTADWLKVKCTNRQELIIVGYTPPQRSREHLGSLLMATHDPDGRLRYVGRVGTGYTRKTLRELKEKLLPLKTDAPPVYNPERARDITWVKPRLVAEVEYGHLTQDKILRHAAFRGLREDKPAAQVVLEVPDAQARSGGGGKGRARADGAGGVVITNPDKILFPPDGPTKLELAEYYEQVAERMWPYVEHRPLSLLRCPDGQKKECFFQKHLSGAEAEPGLKAIPLTEKETEREYRYLDSHIGLRSLVQLGALEIHLWGSRIEADDCPVELVFDLDPAPDVEWKRVVQGTRRLKDLLDRLGLQSFLKLSGGKGVHLHVPIAPRHSFGRAKAFCHAVARQLAEQHPELFTAALSKRDRTGKIFIDYLRNGRGATFIAPFSARAREGATIAVPVAWEALGARMKPDAYSVRTIKKYLKEYPRDPWQGYWDLAQRITVLEGSEAEGGG